VNRASAEHATGLDTALFLHRTFSSRIDAFNSAFALGTDIQSTA
jgi:hypothetical protein